MSSQPQPATRPYKKRKYTGTVCIGEPPMKLRKEVHTMQFKFYKFMELGHGRGEKIQSPALQAHGYQWNLKLYPRGDKTTSTQKQYVSLYLRCDGGGSDIPTIKYTFNCKNRVYQSKLQKMTYGLGWGLKDFIKRDKINQYLDNDGTLTVDVDIQLALPDNGIWYPEPLQPQQFLKDLHESPDLADVEFLIGTTTYKAHKLILSKQAKFLVDLVEDSKQGTRVIIPDVDESTFGALLEYIYTVKEPEFNGVEYTKDILVASDKLGITGLKLLAESTLAAKFLEPKTAANLLIFADSHSCPLLKEAAMKICSSSVSNVTKEDPEWFKVKESKDLLYELFMFDKKSPVDDSCIETLDVGTLRERLQGANLDLDGSKETLMSRLKDYLDGSNEEFDNNSDAKSDD